MGKVRTYSMDTFILHVKPYLIDFYRYACPVNNYACPVSNHMLSEVRDEITYPFLSFNGCTVEV